VLSRLGPDARLPHRLDAGASGLMVVALHPSVHKPLATAFAQRAVKRTYLAVLDGTLPSPTTWSRPVGGKSARSHVEPLAHGGGTTAARLTLDTGRKHQLRVHAAMAGHPILGDRRHGDDVGRRWPRLALHAAQLQLPHPRTGTALALQAPLPPDLVELFALAGHPPSPPPPHRR